MSEPFLGEIRMTSFTFAPRGWALCNGQLLAINTNQALFSLLGTTYGGNGSTNFGLPDLRGRAPVHVGGYVRVGERGGEENHTLTMTEMPAHTHKVLGDAAAAAAYTPAGNTWAAERADPYGTGPDVTMNPAAIAATGGSQPHDNLQPYLVVNFIIALQGVYPRRD